MKLWLLIQNTHFKENDFSGNPIFPQNKPYYPTTVANKSVVYYMEVSENDV